MNNLAVLIFACDRYELLFQGFDYFFRKNWLEAAALPCYFATEQKDLELDGYVSLKSGAGAWTDRLKIVLDQIEETHVIFIQEDMWFDQSVPTGILAPVFAYVCEHDLSLVKLHSSEVYVTQPLEISFSGFQLATVDKEASSFLMSHQVSIWNKSFLYAQLKRNEHPWRNERKGSKRLKKLPNVIYQLDLLGENGKAPLNTNAPDRKPGRYQTVSVNACLHPKAAPFLPELAQLHPSYADQLAYHIEYQITHDGKAKPRKEDMFKKVKNKWRSWWRA